MRERYFSQLKEYLKDDKFWNFAIWANLSKESLQKPVSRPQFCDHSLLLEILRHLNVGFEPFLQNVLKICVHELVVVADVKTDQLLAPKRGGKSVL